MGSTAIQPGRARFAYSREAAKLLASPEPYFAGFAPEPECFDLPYPQLVVSAGWGPAELKLVLAEEAAETGAGGFSERANSFGDQDLLLLKRLPMRPVAVLEPSKEVDLATMELFLNQLPDSIRGSLVRMPPGSDVSRLMHDAMHRHARNLFEQSVSADNALVELRRRFEQMRWSLPEAEPFGPSTSDLAARRQSTRPAEDLRIADPHASYLGLKDEIDTAVSDVIASGQYILGPTVERFEQSFAAYIGVAHGVGVNSGTDAIHLAIRALGIGPGDEVITVSKTSVATVAAIEMSGALPVLVDIEPEWLTMDVGAVEAAIGPNTRAVLAVHLYGQPADLEALSAICRRHGLALIEDCAQAHGAAWGAKRVGSFGAVSCFSFYPTKNLGTIGDGGMIVTNDQGIAEKARALRQYGWTRPQWSESRGWNSRLGPIQAAILEVKLRHLPSMQARRRDLAAGYRQSLTGLPMILPTDRPGAIHAYHLFVVRTHDADCRDRLQRHLTRRGIAVQVHYLAPVHLQPAYKGRLKHLDLKNTNAAFPCVLSLPLYPELSGDQQQRVVDAVKEFPWERHHH